MQTACRGHRRQVVRHRAVVAAAAPAEHAYIVREEARTDDRCRGAAAVVAAADQSH